MEWLPGGLFWLFKFWTTLSGEKHLLEMFTGAKVLIYFLMGLI